MSDVSSNSHGKRAVQAHASSAASDPSHRRGTSRPQMHPTRLFTAQINSILKDKDRPRPRNLCRTSPESESCVREGNAGTPPTVPDKSPPPRPIFEHLSDREGPSGAEDDGDPLEKVCMTPRDPSETIQVKIETNIVTEEPEDEMYVAEEAEAMLVECSDEAIDESVETTRTKSESEGILCTHSDETIQVSVGAPMAATDSPGVLPSSSGLDTTCEEVTSTALSLSPVSSSDLQGSPHPISHEVDLLECTSWWKDSEDSDCEGRESTVDRSDSVRSKSGSKSRKKSSISSSKKIKKSKHSESRKSRHSESRKSKHSESCRSKRQSSPMASTSLQKRILDRRDVNHSKKKKKDLKRKSATGEENSNDLVQGQYLSVVKTYSCEGSDNDCKEYSCEGSDNDCKESSPHEVSGSKLHTISKHRSSNSLQSAFNCQISETISKSSADDFIPLELPSKSDSFRPDTPYKIPTISQSPLHYESPPLGIPPQRPLFFYDSWMSTPPPPPPPTMVHGRFEWNIPPASPLLQLPMSSPNQLLSQPPPTMFAPSQDDKRYQCLQSLHDPPRPNMYGYQLIGDSMLLRFSNKLLRESIIFKEGLRFLGYCVSGQKIGDLLKRLRAGFYHLGKKVVLMIGTNDLFQNTKVEQMCHELRRVVDHLRNEVHELVIITIPPVPLIEHMDHHWNRLNEYNRFIKQLPQKYHDARISVSDVSPLYLLSQEEIEEEEMLAVLNAEIPYCCGCLTCVEESEDVDWDCSSLSDEDITDLSLVTRVLRDTNSHIKPLDTCGLFFDKKMQKCRRDCYELTYSDSSRKDLIHLNLKGLTVIKDQLVKIL